MKTYNIACIPGDGIGKEVIPAGQQVMEVLAKACGTFALEFENFGWVVRVVEKLTDQKIVITGFFKL